MNTTSLGAGGYRPESRDEAVERTRLAGRQSVGEVLADATAEPVAHSIMLDLQAVRDARARFGS